MELLTDIWQFTVAVLENWHGYAAGGVLAIAWEFCERIFGWKFPAKLKLPKSLKLGFLLFGLLVSCFLAWNEQHHLVLGQTPDFRTRLISAWLVPADPKMSPQGSYAICDVMIENHGAPSAIQRMDSTIALPSGKTVTGTFWPAPTNPSITINQPNGAPITLFREAFLGMKVNQPIPTNGALPGWFLIFFPNLEVSEANQGMLKLSFTDYDGGQSHISQMLGGNGNSLPFSP